MEAGFSGVAGVGIAAEGIALGAAQRRGPRTDRVVAARIVVSGVLLPGDELLRVIELAVRADADLVHDCGLKLRGTGQERQAGSVGDYVSPVRGCGCTLLLHDAASVAAATDC